MRSSLWVFVLVLFLTFGVNATDNSTSNQTHSGSGSNTSISGGYTSTTNNSYSGGQTNTTNNNSTNTTKNSQIPVGTATAPSMSSYSQDLCIVGLSAGMQLTGIGVSGGTYIVDENCERMKLSKLLYDFNMRVASIAILCQDDRVFSAMEHAGTPCPFEGKIGEDAEVQWKKYDVERPDYDQYIRKLKRRAKIDKVTEFVPIETEYNLYGDDD
tara:strand:- start:2296 stop:2934 length:639 start_codon:yes stop_codon:yes gene_type:complete